MYGGQSMTFGLGNELLGLHTTINEQALRIGDLELEAAWYKALFFHKDSLADKLHKQIVDNLCNRFNADYLTYRTLDDMLADSLITKEERKFCDV